MLEKFAYAYMEAQSVMCSITYAIAFQVSGFFDSIMYYILLCSYTFWPKHSYQRAYAQILSRCGRVQQPRTGQLGHPNGVSD